MGEPAVGLQEVWVTYTAASSSSPLHGEWQSLDLTQQVNPSYRFNGTLALPLGSNASDVRYMVQAVNGVGLRDHGHQPRDLLHTGPRRGGSERPQR